MMHKDWSKNIQYLLLFCILLLMLRVGLSRTLNYAFLGWNLLLALIPFLVSNYLTNQKETKSGVFKLIICFGIWLLFLPNAPYLITDFIHIRHSSSSFIWYDILLIFTYASTGFILAIISINQILQIVQQRWTIKLMNLLLFGIAFLCGFGIYLGRVLRFNSWDIFSSPFYVIKRSILSFSDKNTWLITIGFGSLLYVVTKLMRLYSLPSTKSCK